MLKRTKILRIIYMTFVVIWPLLFSFGVGYVESAIKTYAAKTFDAKFTAYILMLYIVSGAVFAFIGVTGKKYSTKVIVFVNIASSIVGILGVVIYILSASHKLFISKNLFTFINNSFQGNNAVISIGFSVFLAIYEFIRVRNSK